MKFEEGTRAYVVQDGRLVKARLEDSRKDITSYVEQKVRLTARKFDSKIIYRNGNWEVDKGSNHSAPTVNMSKTPITVTAPEISDAEKKLLEYEKCLPDDIIISKLKWKALCLAVEDGQNILLIGESGTGKTETVQSVADTLNRPLFKINLGSTQDPRSVLIGMTHFSPDKGTHFVQSEFVTAIQTPNAVILLDEVSRAHPEAVNILMTVLDPRQRYLRLDEGNAVVNVHPSVSFLGTANVGASYTATRVMDKALTSRFTFIEMEAITSAQEHRLLKRKFPTVPVQTLKTITEIAGATRTEIASANSKIQSSISTRQSIQFAYYMQKGFSLLEAAELVVYPMYSTDGGNASERTYIKQVVQKFLPNPTSDKELFGLTDTVMG
jgi:MoxR-like ATPase